ncbi:MAG: fibrobacter succinogenes major paralogous domain-containing protein [Sphingomonadales bacterium]
MKIGNQIWMAENLNVETFRNGDFIPKAETSNEWRYAADNKEPAWCYYNNKYTNGLKYGKLYNWYTVDDPRGLAPEGWRIPSQADFAALITFLGGAEKAINKIKFKHNWKEGNKLINYLNIDWILYFWAIIKMYLMACLEVIVFTTGIFGVLEH